MKRTSKDTQFKPADHTGLRNNMITALYQHPTKKCKNGYRIWVIQCDCGTIFEKPSYALARRYIDSCGCTRFKPIGRNRIPNNGAHVNVVFKTYKKSAIIRGHAFNLTKDQVRFIIEQQCFYCGSLPKEKFHKNLSGTYFCNGIDRVNNSAGYFYDNCVPCCKICNFMKSDMNQKDWLEHIHKIAKHMT